MTAKCTYKTRITADSRYTHFITNGDVSERRRSVGNGRDTIVYQNIKTPMAPYLFFLGVGTYDEFTKEIEYPEGDKFILELLVFPGSDKNEAEMALDVLYHSVMWIYLFTGADKYNNILIKEKIFSLVYEMENYKKKNDLINLNKI